MPLVKETLVPVTTWQEAGAVEVLKTVRTVTQEVEVPLWFEEVTVERVPFQSKVLPVVAREQDSGDR